FDLAQMLVSKSAAALTWMLVCLTVPFMPHAWLIYPEIPAALVVALVARRLWRPPASTAAALGGGLLLAALPWLHTKFVVLVALLALLELIRLWPRWPAAIALAAPIACSTVAWLAFFHYLYGVFDPEAPYGAYAERFVLARNIPRGVLGL